MDDHLHRLSDSLAVEGPTPFHADLVRLAARVKTAAPGAAAALADADAPEIVRLRAFSVVARHLKSGRESDRVA